MDSTWSMARREEREEDGRKEEGVKREGGGEEVKVCEKIYERGGGREKGKKGEKERNKRRKVRS